MSSIEEDPMEQYRQPESTAVTGADEFAASRAQLEKMITCLGSVEMMACTQQMLEDSSPRPAGSCNGS